MRKFKVWLDSGANTHSCFEQEVTLDEIGVSDDEFDEMSEEEKEELFRDIAWSRMDWGFKEIT